MEESSGVGIKIPLKKGQGSTMVNEVIMLAGGKSPRLWPITKDIPLAEAQACGKPVVAFDIGPHPEVIDENGALIETGNIEKFAQACIKKLRRVREEYSSGTDKGNI